MCAYRPPSVRNFKLFIGELTAEAAAVHISLLESKKCEHKNEMYWSERAIDACIKLDGIKSERVLNSQNRLAIVSLYSGFDLFLEEIESECKHFGFQWKKNDKTSPLVILQNNFTKKILNQTHFQYKSDSVDYFRLLRNSIAHPSAECENKAIHYYNSKQNALCYLRDKYKMISAPSAPNNLSFHDVKFWCQFLIDFTEQIAEHLEPTKKMIFNSIPFDTWRKYGGRHDRIKNAAKNYIRSQYSYKLDECNEIIDSFYDDSLA
ncbi:hypothetical protein J7S95_18665 [Providencia stuartii]|uniref:hypothetical protein n=1 Tax=Providencia stuartii TaxID=588 RepID=UPI001B466F6B|nr:hypothetical protein [Providencia stuartii]MBQ0458723.1 hypothetical protein [Providencia stuartii]